MVHYSKLPPESPNAFPGPLQNPDLPMVEKMKLLMFGDVLFEAEGLIYGVQGCSVPFTNGSNRSPIEPFTNQVHAILVEPFTNLQYWWLVGNPRLLLQHKVQQTCFKNVHIMPAHA